MGNFTAEKQSSHVDIPKAPKFCTSPKCVPNPKKSFINYVEAEDENYQRIVGLASVLMPQERASNRRSMDFGMQFKTWHTRCTEHFLTDPVKVDSTWTGM